MAKPLMDLTESELRGQFLVTAANVGQWSYNDFLADYGRRAVTGQGRVAAMTSVVTALAAVLALALSVLALSAR